MHRFIREIDIVEDKSPSVESKATIFQLSDLHITKADAEEMNRNGLPGSFKQLQNRLREANESFRCDFLAVTGDIIEGDQLSAGARRECFLTAKAFLMKIVQEDLGLSHPEKSLIVVPGNHDYKYKGFFWFWGRSKGVRVFNEVFGGLSQHRYFPQFKILFGCFDSNKSRDRLGLAMGEIDIQEIENLQVGLREMRLRGIDDSKFIKIALVHHHPMPIADAEDLEKAHWAERALGRKLEAAPEFMLMRNSGAFLKSMLDTGFRLILHGHLHCNGYWIPATYLEGKYKWIEVLGCGSATRPDSTKRCSFNIIQILDNRVIELRRMSYRERVYGSEMALLPLPPAELTTFNGHQDVSVDEDLHISCNSHWFIVDIIYPNGDLLIREIIDKLQYHGEQPRSCFPLVMFASHVWPLGLPRVKCLNHEVHVSIGSEPVNKTLNGKPAVCFNVDFSTALIKGHVPISITLERFFPAVMFTSVEDKKKHGPAEDEGRFSKWDYYRVFIRWPSRFFSIQIRFFGHECTPSEVVGRELTGSNQEVQLTNKAQVGNVQIWNQASCEELGLPLGVIGPTATLNIMNPRLGHFYGFNWKLEESDPSPTAPALQNLRKNLESSLGKKLAEKVKGFLSDIVSMTSAVVQTEESVMIVPVRAYLFGCNQDGLAYCHAMHPQGADYLMDKKIRYGEDCVGTAWRAGTPAFFSRRVYLKRMIGVPLSPEFADKVHSIAAFPMLTKEGMVGIVAVASENVSAVTLICENRLSAENWAQRVGDLVRNFFFRGE